MIDKKMNIKKCYKKEGEKYNYDVVKRSKDLWPGWYSTYDQFYVQLLPTDSNGGVLVKDFDGVKYVQYIIWKLSNKKRYKSSYSIQKLYVTDNTTLKNIFDGICNVEGIIVQDKILDCEFLDEAY